MIPPVSLGVANGVPHPTLAVTYHRKDPAEQKLVKERVDEIAYFLELHRHQTFPMAACAQRNPMRELLNVQANQHSTGIRHTRWQASALWTRRH